MRRLIVRPKFRKKGEIDAIPFLGPLPGRVVPGGVPSAGLVAHLIVSKYMDHPADLPHGEVFAHVEARIDNNFAEQPIRPTKLGMKNWLFFGSPNAGRTTATIYTILECCRRHSVELTADLKDVPENLPNMLASEAEQLTPSNRKKRQVDTR